MRDLKQKYKELNFRIRIISTTLLTSIIQWLEKCKNNVSNKLENPISLESLSPTCDIENENRDGNLKNDFQNIYFSALENAIDNRNNYNIGITSSYGSGKSSIIKSFSKLFSYKYKFLSISLASFNSAKELVYGPAKAEDKCKECKHEINQLIELSILQQLFYSEKASNLPHSRFKRISKISWWKLAILTLSFILWLLSIFFVFEPTFIQSTTIVKEFYSAVNKNRISEICIVIFIVGLFYLIYNLARIARKTKLNKLNVSSGEIELDVPNDRSILNRYLDEIVYFFEKTACNVLIIEDLDRFDNTAIFTKLHEINNLLKNSKAIKRRIVFVYAVKDNLFKDQKRIKFFDVIIPIVPIINSSNSRDKFKVMLDENCKYHTVSFDLLTYISMYISDMRLLKNIINEFVIYKNKIGKDLIDDKLLAMIVFKNIYPTEFVEMHSGKGIVYEILKSKKHLLLENKINEIDARIVQLNNAIADMNNFTVQSKMELIGVYVNKLWSKLNEAVSVNIKNENFKYVDLNKEEVFQKFIKNDIIEYVSYSGGNQRTSIKFIDIENSVDPVNKYEMRLKLIKLKQENAIETYKKEIEQLNFEKNDLNNWSVEKIANRFNIEIFNPLLAKEKYQLTLYLLRNGYINEDFHDYISIFHPGSMTYDDKEFYFSIKNRKQLGYKFKLTSLNLIIESLRFEEFEQIEILNIYIVDFLLSNQNKYIDNTNRIFEQLSNESHTSVEFIDAYIENGSHLDLFINLLAQTWKNMWKFIDASSNFSTEKKDKYLLLIIQYGELSNIHGLDINGCLSHYISNKTDFLSLIPISLNDKMKSIISDLCLVFNTLQDAMNNIDLFEYIIDVRYYNFNIEVLELIINERGVKIDDLHNVLKTQNYTTILKSDFTPLIENINENLDLYYECIYSQLEDNTEEDELKFADLLNSNLDDGYKENIIKKNNIPISNLEMVKNPELWQILACHSKFTAFWENIFIYFEEFKTIDDFLVQYLNNEQIFIELSNFNIDGVLRKEKSIVDGLVNNIIMCEALSIDSYNYLLKSLNYTYNSLSFEILSPNKIDCLINYKIFNPTKSNFDYLKIKFPNKLINLLEKNKNQFDNVYKFIEYDSVNALQLMHSKEISTSNKISFVLYLDKEHKEIIDNSVELCNAICQYIVPQENLLISSDFLLTLVTYSNEIDLKLYVAIMLMKTNKKKDFISQILTLMGLPYSDLIKKTRKPIKLEMNNVNQKLAFFLESQCYISTQKPHGKEIWIRTKLK
jgi:hypothetical protein